MNKEINKLLKRIQKRAIEIRGLKSRKKGISMTLSIREKLIAIFEVDNRRDRERIAEIEGK
ncbi:hypothetical protein LCGC14_2229910 [marine sediment metagenome]|uniref:Uncharacterized protein n=1 Tax=marine sediment metagenome TaxID=412755 RepID=A0A0F9D8F4_9ZZZZ